MSANSVAIATVVGKGFQSYRPDRIFRFGQWVKIHYWTEEEDGMLRRDYRGTIESLRELGMRLGVSENSVRQRLTRMGILRQAVRWSAEDEEYLEENYAKYSPKVLARKLHKSVNVVTAKAHRMKVANGGRTGWFTKKDVAEIFGVDMGWITRRVNGRGLKFEMESYDPDRTPQKGYYDAWRISEEALRDFIRRYPEELTRCNVDFVMLVDILAGVKV